MLVVDGHSWCSISELSELELKICPKLMAYGFVSHNTYVELTQISPSPLPHTVSYAGVVPVVDFGVVGWGSKNRHLKTRFEKKSDHVFNFMNVSTLSSELN